MTERHHPLANSQFHNTIEMTPVDSDREILQEMTLSQFLAHEEEGRRYLSSLPAPHSGCKHALACGESSS